jgi:hypothetical protein
MTPKQFDRALRGFTRRRPFRPSLIEFVSGDRLRIGHPEAIELRGDIWVNVTGPEERYRLFVASDVC